MEFNKHEAKELEARHRLALKLRAAPPKRPRAGAKYAQSIPFPTGLAPVPQPISPPPTATHPLPQVDVIAMMDTEAEARAMADVLTPGHRWESWATKAWYAYTVSNFAQVYLPQLGPESPARSSGCLGSYFLTQIAGKKVLCFKTELHMHEDAKKMPNGTYSLPIKDMLIHIIQEAKPSVFLTTGTSGGLYCSMHLGDVVVSRAARFMCQRDFASAAFNNQTFKSQWNVPTSHQAAAEKLMQQYAGNLSNKTKPPQKNCACSGPGYPTRIFFDGKDGIPEFHPILTTDFFEFGTSTNNLDKLGMAVEMDDATLGLACNELNSPPKWACVRNLSDPAINGHLPSAAQDKCAEYYYTEFGYWTTVMSALTTWAIIAGL
jgi:nucleoside phosphorylase